jgi:hypothetical protein
LDDRYKSDLVISNNGPLLKLWSSIASFHRLPTNHTQAPGLSPPLFKPPRLESSNKKAIFRPALVSKSLPNSSLLN